MNSSERAGSESSGGRKADEVGQHFGNDQACCNVSLFGLVRVVFHHFHRLVYKVVLFEIVFSKVELTNLVLNT